MTETTVYEQPIEELIEEVEEEPADPLAEFFGEIDANRTLRMHVWELTEYKRNGLRGRRAPGARWICDFPFSDNEIETYRSTIQSWQPTGGMFYIEVREGGVPVKTWSEEIGGVPGFQSQPQQPQHPAFSSPVIVHQHPQQSQQPAAPSADPMQLAEQGMTFAMKLVDMAQKLAPQPANVVVNPNGQEHPEKPTLLESVLSAAVPALISAGKPNEVKEIISVLGGGSREPTFLEATGPLLLEALKQFGPRLGTAMDLWIIERQQKLMGQNALPPGQPINNYPANSVPQQAQRADPQTRAWMKVVGRIIDDCFEAAEAPNEAMRPSPAVTASIVVDLVDRYDQTEPIVVSLVESTPEQVIENCAALFPQQAQVIESLKQSQVALAWIRDLQETTKKLLEEGEDDDGTDATGQ